MEESTKLEIHLTSAAAFVEGGIQQACDDTCSICLEEFSDSDPSTVTGCKHEFHLQCILEWCQRSSQCPMCWQDISLKDPISQELLDAIEQEKTIRNTPRNTTIFHHPTLGEFELQHLPANATDGELEERIIQHIAAAAAMGRARHISRREGHRSRASAQGRPQYLVFSTHPSASPSAPLPSSRREGESSPVVTVGRPSLTSAGNESPSPITMSPSIQVSRVSSPTSVSSDSPANPHGSSSTNRIGKNIRKIMLGRRRFPTQSSPISHEIAGPSELHSFSESLKSRINIMSMRYKESITKSTRGWKEKLFSRNTSISDLPQGGRDRLNIRENTRTISTSALNTLDDGSHLDQVNQPTTEHVVNHCISANNAPASSPAPSASN